MTNLELIYFIGIDPSLTNTGLSILEYEITHNEYGNNVLPRLSLFESKLIKTTPKESMEHRLNYILNEVKFLTGILHCGGIYIEGLSFASFRGKILELGALHYMIRSYLYTHEIDFTIVPPKSLKKWVTGNGNAKKEMVMESTKNRWNIEFSNDNLCDAHGLARMAFENWKEKNPNYSIKNNFVKVVNPRVSLRH